MASNFRLDELIRRYPPREKKQKKAQTVIVSALTG